MVNSDTVVPAEQIVTSDTFGILLQSHFLLIRVFQKFEPRDRYSLYASRAQSDTLDFTHVVPIGGVFVVCCEHHCRDAHVRCSTPIMTIP